MNLIEKQNERARRLSELFTQEQMQGARWNLPGWAEANQQLDDEGLDVMPELKPTPEPKSP